MVRPSAFSLRTSSLNDGVSRPSDCGEVGRPHVRSFRDEAQHRSRPGAVRAPGVEPVEAGAQVVQSGVVEIGRFAQHGARVVAARPDAHAVVVALGLLAQEREHGVAVGEAGTPRVVVGDVVGRDAVDRDDVEHAQRRPQRATGLHGGAQLPAEDRVDLAGHDPLEHRHLDQHGSMVVPRSTPGRIGPTNTLIRQQEEA